MGKNEKAGKILEKTVGFLPAERKRAGLQKHHSISSTPWQK
jgi:hypothetical protein